MNTVDALTPIQITMVTDLLQRRHKQIYTDVFRCGLQMSLRISDLLSLKFSSLDIAARSLTLTEAKTGKIKHVRLNNTALDIIQRRRIDNPAHVYLFQTDSNRSKGVHISRESVSKVFADVAVTLGLAFNTHSMRKSRGMAMYNDGVPIEKIAQVLNHSNTSSTLRYLGITRESMLQTFDDYEL
jgi:integrase